MAVPNMKQTLRPIAYLLILIAAIAAIAGLLLIRGRPGVSPGELASLSLRLPIPAVDMAFAPYYLAVDKGIFEKHGPPGGDPADNNKNEKGRQETR